MKIENIELWLVFEAKDTDLNIYYKGANTKGKRPFLIVGFSPEEKIIKIRAFNGKKNSQQNPNLIEVDELLGSTLNPNNEIRTISYDLFRYAEYVTRLSQTSVDKIKLFFKKSNKFLTI